MRDILLSNNYSKKLYKKRGDRDKKVEYKKVEYKKMKYKKLKHNNYKHYKEETREETRDEKQIKKRENRWMFKPVILIGNCMYLNEPSKTLFSYILPYMSDIL